MKNDREERPEQTRGEHIDIREHGRSPEGRRLTSDSRLFMNLLAYGGCSDARGLIEQLEAEQIPGVLYEDINDPQGIALLTFSEDPSFFVDGLRRFLNRPPFAGAILKPEYTILGRTYTMGYEPNLEEALLQRPRRRVCNPEYPWAIWYPLRRAGSFEQLPAKQQQAILMEHGSVGRAFGKAGYVLDIRLACHGLDKNDNDFVIGLVGPQLYPLSAIVQRMRRTKQTSRHLARLGPFFIGRAIWRTKQVTT